MKSTGMVRRIDDLGRIVVPKEIRHTLRIREGDPLEIYTDGQFVCFKKYNTTELFDSAIKNVVDMLDDQEVSNCLTEQERNCIKWTMQVLSEKWKERNERDER